MRIISYRDLAPGRFAKSVEKIGAALARGDFAAAGLKKLSPTPYWRAKLNDEARLLMQFAPHRGETVCLFLEVIPNHVYEKSRFLRGAAIDWSKIESGPDDAAPQPEPTLRGGLELRWLPAHGWPGSVVAFHRSCPCSRTPRVLAGIPGIPSQSWRRLWQGTPCPLLRGKNDSASRGPKASVVGL